MKSTALSAEVLEFEAACRCTDEEIQYVAWTCSIINHLTCTTHLHEHRLRMQLLQTITEVIQNLWGAAVTVNMFGSLATRTACSSSDMDVVVLGITRPSDGCMCLSTFWMICVHPLHIPPTQHTVASYSTRARINRHLGQLKHMLSVRGVLHNTKHISEARMPILTVGAWVVGSSVLYKCVI